jgi:hypothetical protein
MEALTALGRLRFDAQRVNFTAHEFAQLEASGTFLATPSNGKSKIGAVVSTDRAYEIYDSKNTMPSP